MAKIINELLSTRVRWLTVQCREFRSLYLCGVECGAYGLKFIWLHPSQSFRRQANAISRLAKAQNQLKTIDRGARPSRLAASAAKNVEKYLRK